MLSSDSLLSGLLGKLYDSAADATLWPDFLTALAEAAQADSAALLLHNVAHTRHSISLHSGVDPQVVRLYAEHYGQHDVWVKRAALVPGLTAVSQDVCTFSELVRTEFYNDFLKRVDVIHAMWAILQNNKSGVLNIGVYRGKKRGEFAQSDLHLLRLLEPHIRRASSLHLQISEMRAANQEFSDALDLIATGVVLLGHQGRIVALNRAASEILACNDGLLATPSGLRTENSIQSAHLEAVVRAAEETSTGKGLAAGGALLISRRRGNPLHLLITPVGRLPVESHHRVVAVAFIDDPAQKDRTPVHTLQKLFGLTPAECRLAVLLNEGHGLRRIADIMGLSTNTLKSQLASIYRKTGTSRQAQLTSLLARLSIASSEDVRRQRSRFS